MKPRVIRQLQCSLLFLTLLLPSSLVFATVTNTDASPASANVPLGQSTNVSVIWRVTRDNSNCVPGDQTVTSTSGTFRLGGRTGQTLGTVSTVLTQTIVCDARIPSNT